MNGLAENSKREQIILQLISELEEIESIATVIRRMQRYADLQAFAVTQFPVIAVVGRLPIPEGAKHLRISWFQY